MYDYDDAQRSIRHFLEDAAIQLSRIGYDVEFNLKGPTASRNGYGNFFLEMDGATILGFKLAQHHDFTPEVKAVVTTAQLQTGPFTAPRQFTLDAFLNSLAVHDIGQAIAATAQRRDMPPPPSPSSP